MADEKIVYGKTTDKVADRLFDSIAKHSIELQRMANYVEKDLAAEYIKLSKELDAVLVKHEAGVRVTKAGRQKLLAKVIQEGEVAIKKSGQALAELVRNNLIEVGNLESEFSVGSINKAVTGKGNVAFITNKLGPKKISSIADNLIVQGAPQKELWARQSTNLVNKFKDVIRTGWEQEQDIATISQAIRGTAANGYKDGIMNVSKHQANSLARTSIASVANQVREETYLANDDVIQGVQFIAVLDNNTTPVCRAHSGDKWDMTPEGWKPVEGAHNYVQPPLHFNCRSTLIPRMYTPGELAKRAPKKLNLVPDKEKKSLGKRLGVRVCRSPCKYTDADAWLKTQPVEYQKNVLGKAFDAWTVGNISFKRMVTQKGRMRTTEELANIYKQEGLIPEGIIALKTAEKFKPYKGASKEFRDQLAKTEKGEFLKMEEKLMTGQTVTRAESDKFGNILRNADPTDLEYKNSFAPTNFNEFLGNKAKRLAFYNHTAKRYERISNMRKGDLSKRKTSSLNDIDKQVLEELKQKISSDTSISATNSKILLEMFDESARIVGTQRSLPMIESLFTLARKTDFSDIDDFVGYLNNSMANAVNSYFSRVKRLEIRLTASTEKDVRFSMLSENAKSKQKQYLNSESSNSGLRSKAEATEIKKSISKIGKRDMRYFEGSKANHLNTDLELTMQANIDLYLGVLQDDFRMSPREARAWMKRVREPKFAEKRTPEQILHYKRVKFITDRFKPGDKVLLDDKIMSSPLFKEFNDNAWSGRGFPPEIREKVGQVLQDAETYLGLQGYLEGKKIQIYRGLKNSMNEVIGKAPLTNTVSATVQDVIKPLDKLDIKASKKYAENRAKKIEGKLNNEGLFAKLNRKKEKMTRQEKVELERLESDTRWEALSDAVYVKDVSRKLDDLILGNVNKPNNPFYREANMVLKDDVVKLAQMVNREVFVSVEKGKIYLNTVNDLGDRYYYLFRNELAPDRNDSIRMGHFLIESAINSGLVKRLKVVQSVSRDGLPPRDELQWLLKEANEDWRQAFLLNKTNYDVDGLPSIGKPPEIVDGIYSASGRSTIRKQNKEWVQKEASKSSSKPWINNLKYESKTGLQVNGYIYDVMTELESRGKPLIPKPPANAKDVVARSKYDSYMRARNSAKGLRDQTFYNRMSNDRYGRTYADTAGLHWQGDDITRSLMMFDKGVKLGKNGFDDFSRHFMNLSGFDKIPMKTRIQLFKKIDEDLIRKTVADPVKYDWWYTESDWLESGVIKNLVGIDKRDIAEIQKLAMKANPSDEGSFQLLALMKERVAMLDWVKDGNKIEDFVSRLPSAIDGTTNVLQHFAGISRDKSIAKAVNMVRQRNVADAYIQLRDQMDEIGKAMDPSNPLKKYIDLPGLTHAKRRKSVKKGLMTSQYNAGARTLGESYFEALEDVQVNGSYIFREATSRDKIAVGRIILEASEQAYPEATKVRYLLNNFAEAHEIAGKEAIELKTPLGFPYRQSYKKTAVEQIELSTYKGEKLKLNVTVDLDEVDYSKQNRAFAPNIIHAMDATHKSLVVNKLQKLGVDNFSMIHDSFGSNFGNMALLSKVTKESFLELYEKENFLEYLAKMFKDNGVKLQRFARDEKGRKIKDGKGGFLTEEIPVSEIQSLGDFKFSDFLELEYFFH